MATFLPRHWLTTATIAASTGAGLPAAKPRTAAEPAKNTASVSPGVRVYDIRDCGVEGGGQMPYTMAVRAAIDAQAMRAKAERFWFLPASS